MNTYLITKHGDDYGYICVAENDSAFIDCLSEVENETMIHFIAYDLAPERGILRLTEVCNGREVMWDVKKVTTDGRFPPETLVVVNKSKSR